MAGVNRNFWYKVEIALSRGFLNVGYNNYIRLDCIVSVEECSYRFAKRQKALSQQPGNGLDILDLTKRRPVATVIYLADGRRVLSAFSWPKLQQINKEVLKGVVIPVRGGSEDS